MIKQYFTNKLFVLAFLSLSSLNTISSMDCKTDRPKIQQAAEHASTTVLVEYIKRGLRPLFATQ